MSIDEHTTRLRIFSDPTTWPGLPPRTAARQCWSIGQRPSFTPWAAWCVLEDRDDQIWVRRLVGSVPSASPDPATTFATEVPADRGVLEDLRSAFAEITLGLPPNDLSIGLDGTTFHVDLRQGRSVVLSLAWWQTPPAEWSGIETFFAQTRRVLDSGLPACTLPIAGIGLPS